CCTDTGIYWNALETDISSTPRPQGLCYDIGAYEYESTDSNAVLPMVSTLPAENIFPTYATLKGNITDDGGTQLIAKGIKYSTTSGSDPETEGTLVKLLEFLNEGEFEIFLTGLSPNTTYYYRAYCENRIDSIYADEKLSFTTTDSIVINPDINGIVYVEEDGIGDGSSWASSLNGNELQNGIDHPNTKEIWVAKGKYIPTNWPRINVYNGTTEREKHFALVNDKKLYGGFNGNETLIEQRNIKENETILSGDIGVKGYEEDNCYHVIQNLGGSDTTNVIDGFTIQDGYADGSITTGNFHMGGGIYNRLSSSKIRNCILKNNFALYGGGISILTNPAYPILENTIVTENTAEVSGGGILTDGAYPTIRNCLITQNTAGKDGGGIYHWAEYGTFGDSDTLRIHNCTIVDNVAPRGSGIHIKSDAIYGGDNVEIIQNSVIWGDANTFSYEYEEYYEPVQTIDHCAIAGGYYGEDNINLSENNAGDEFSPYFSDPDNGNYMIQAGSPLRDAGIWTDDVPLYDLAGLERDSLPDIGCYEYDVTSIYNEQFTMDNCELYQNYPNPFNPSTNIRFYINKTDKVELLLYNVAGQLVKKILDEELKAGSHCILFEASDLNSGMYYYMLKTDDLKISKKMLLLK
ncbi:MAG: T9SS type A sorting domain-containing protein, partial [Candidatus Delongbacteria bacterium]|nr:T9SS type A sorting domain-containing protein [Candidatus Delongbacteria bacterium]